MGMACLADPPVGLKLFISLRFAVASFSSSSAMLLSFSFFISSSPLSKELRFAKAYSLYSPIGSSSVTGVLEAGCDALRADGIKVRVVSAPSEGLFRGQSKEYQESVLPKNAKIFGMTAGLPVTLQGLVGANGKVWGMESFGFSAPYKVLDEKLGYTGENVYKQVKAFLAEA